MIEEWEEERGHVVSCRRRRSRLEIAVFAARTVSFVSNV
jgi:hypothetical protein